jgi:hypothetical protein
VDVAGDDQGLRSSAHTRRPRYWHLVHTRWAWVLQLRCWRPGGLPVTPRRSASRRGATANWSACFSRQAPRPNHAGEGRGQPCRVGGRWGSGGALQWRSRAGHGHPLEERRRDRGLQLRRAPTAGGARRDLVDSPAPAREQAGGAALDRSPAGSGGAAMPTLCSYRVAPEIEEDRAMTPNMEEDRATTGGGGHRGWCVRRRVR